MENYDVIRQYQLRGNVIVVYDQWQGSSRRKRKNLFQLQEFEKNRKKAYSGKLSKGATKRLQKAVTILTQITPTRTVQNPVTGKSQHIKLNFITLTISDNTK